MKHMPINKIDLLPSMPINADSEFWCKGCGEELAEDWIFCECCERISQMGMREQSSQDQASLSEGDGSKDTRICACCKRNIPEDVEICFQCVGYNYFEPRFPNP